MPLDLLFFPFWYLSCRNHGRDDYVDLLAHTNLKFSFVLAGCTSLVE